MPTSMSTSAGTSAPRRAARRSTGPTADPELVYGGAGVSAGDSERPDGPTPVIAPIGGPALVGMLYPALSSGPYAITRQALERLGGFSADARGFEADQDLLNRAAV